MQAGGRSFYVVRTAIISDLHLGGLSGEGVLEHASIREILLTELSGADRVVLLGDAIELRDLPVGTALELARPFFTELAEAIGGAEVVLVPGNHDHHLAGPLLAAAAVSAGGALGLEQIGEAEGGPSRRIAEWLQPSKLTIAYPGIWLREDVYAMHGHHMDPHFTLPRAESVAAAAVARITSPLPDPATPLDYERLLGPVNGLTFALAQAGTWQHRGAGARPSERAFTWLSRGGAPSGDGGRGEGGKGRARRGQRARRTAALAAGGLALRAATAGVNRVLGASFDPDLSVAAINRGGIAAATELARRLRIEAAHVITGHTHHAGPPHGGAWPLHGGGDLHNTGNWIFSRPLHRGAAGGPFWPGTVIWLGDDGPPRATNLLADIAPADLAALSRTARDARKRLPGLAPRTS